MSIGTGDISFLASAVSGSAGGAITGSAIPSGVANNLFPDVTSTERTNGIELDRKIFVKNGNATDSAVAPGIWVPTLPTNCTLSIGLGIDSADDTDPDQGNLQGWTSAAVAALVSDGADARLATLFGLDNSGSPVPVKESITLNGLTEVLTTTVWSSLWGISLDGTDSARYVTIQQGSGGTVRGSIPPDEIVTWLWLVSPDDISSGLLMPDLAAGDAYGVWIKIVVSAGAGAVRPNQFTVSFQDTA
jgi:hypothetical protein